jgi:FkbM family methyltransferase
MFGRRAGRNSVLQAIDSRNQQTLEEIARFRAAYASGKSTFDDFSRLKHAHPYFGFVPCHAQGVDFVLFHANDDLVAWEYQWFGDNFYEQKLVAAWVEACRERTGPVLDIGAYTGLMAILAAFANERSEIHLFEPMPRTVERANVNLKANGLAKRVRLHTVAASDDNGTADINLYREPNFLGTGNSIFDKGLKVFDVVTIKTVRIDDALPGIAPTVVKIDVEGHELPAIRGMSETIERSRPWMIVEVWEHTRDEVLKLLRGWDYRCEPADDPDQRVANYTCTPD